MIMRKGIKKAIATVLTAALAMSVCSPAFAADSKTKVDMATKEKICEIYLLDMETVNALSQQELEKYLDAIDTATVVSKSEKYFKETVDSNNEVVLVESTKAEYENDLNKRDSSTSWLKMTSSVVSKDSRRGIGTVRCEWLIRPTFCRTDVVGVNVKQGSIIAGQQTGTYTVYYNDGTAKVLGNYDSSDYDVLSTGAILEVPLDPGYDKLITKHIITSSTNFYKESGSEQLTTSYLHQRLSMTISPEFSFDSAGALVLSGGLSLGMYYDAAYDNDSIDWTA